MKKLASILLMLFNMSIISPKDILSIYINAKYANIRGVCVKDVQFALDICDTVIKRICKEKQGLLRPAFAKAIAIDIQQRKELDYIQPDYELLVCAIACQVSGISVKTFRDRLLRMKPFQVLLERL